MVDHIRATEGQVEHEKDLGKGMHKASHPCYSHQNSTYLPVHNDGVVEGLTDGHITIISHHCEQEHLSATKEVDKEKLCHAAPQRYSFPFSQQIGDEFGGCSRGVADLHEGQVAEEEIHGGTKTSAGQDDEYNEEIPQQNCCVQEQKYHKANFLHILIGRKSQKNEFSHVMCVSHEAATRRQ